MAIDLADRKVDVSRRRQLITGGSALGAAALFMASGEAKAATAGTYNVRDFGASPDGSWDAAVAAAIASGMAIYFPAGKYPLKQAIATNGRSLVVFGDGPQASRLVFLNATNGITFTGSRTDTSVDHLVVHHIGLAAANPGCQTAIDCRWVNPQPPQPPLTNGATCIHYALIEDVAIDYDNTSSRFFKGIYHSGGGNSRIQNCILAQLYQAASRDATGIHITGGGSDIQVQACQFAGQALGMLVEQPVEGTRIVDCSFLGVTVGLRCDGTNSFMGLQWVFVSGCHFDVNQVGIDAPSVMQLRCDNNYFLANKIENVTWYGVKITRSTTSNNFFEDSSITNNLFHRNDSGQGASYPILVSGLDATRKATRILIDSNRFGGLAWNNTAIVDANTTLVTYTETNLADNGETWSDSGLGNTMPGGHWDTAVSAENGGVINATASGDYTRNGRAVSFQVTIVVWSNTSGAGALHVPMPFAVAAHTTLHGMQINTGTGPAVSGIIPADGPYVKTLRVVYYNNTTPCIAGMIYQLSGVAIVA